MKKLLITGKNGYIGCSVKRYLEQWPQDYQVDTLSLTDGSWETCSFSGYDSVLHTAGIVHQPQSKNDPKQWELYHRVNVLLTTAVAKKAKAEGVGQFLFLSSESVYGLTAPLGTSLVITADTPLTPTDHYGNSKKMAEEALTSLEEDGFRVAILRPPLIYGKGCKGNYCTLKKFAEKLPVFPKVDNARSMLYVDNLSEFIRLLLEDQARGIFCPQNAKYVNTSQMVQEIARAHGRKLALLPGCTGPLKLLSRVTNKVDKAFGSLCYDQALSRYSKNYCIYNFEQSIAATEGENP